MALRRAVRFSYACLRGAGILAVTIALVPPAAALFAVRGRCPAVLRICWHRAVRRIAGLRVRMLGGEHAGQAELLTSNHASYLDILVIAGQVDTDFIAKADVAGWPAIGWLARLIGTVFVERAPRQAAHQRDALGRHLADGCRLCLFPEGTSSDGLRVLPFKSALLDAAIRADISVQPVTVVYRDPHARYAWYADMTLVPHIGQVLMQRGVDVDVIFHAPVASSDFADRKALSRYLEETVRRELDRRVAVMRPADERETTPQLAGQPAMDREAGPRRQGA
jgi:1-acyl-sn-glycerol-3-phosphate acyltransferase